MLGRNKMVKQILYNIYTLLTTTKKAVSFSHGFLTTCWQIVSYRIYFKYVKAEEELGKAKEILEYNYQPNSDRLSSLVKQTLNSNGIEYTTTTETFAY